MAFPSSPTVGDLFTVGNQQYKWNGIAWDISSDGIANTSVRYNYVATSGQTIFNATYSIGFVDVYLNGIKLIPATDFTATNGTTVVLTSGATTGDDIEIVAYGTFELADTYTQTQADNLLAAKEPADATILKQADIGTSVLAPNGDGSQLTGLPEGYTDADANAFDLGVNQTWQDVSGSRAMEVNYTNTTGKPIMIMVTFNNDTTSLYINNTYMTRQLTTVDGSVTPIVATIPNGDMYKFSGGSYDSWVELR